MSTFSQASFFGDKGFVFQGMTERLWGWPRSLSDFKRHSLFALLGGCGTRFAQTPSPSDSHRVPSKSRLAESQSRGFAPLVAGKVPTLPRRGGRESDRRRAPVGRGKVKLFPLQRDSGRLNLQRSLHPSPKTSPITEK